VEADQILRDIESALPYDNPEKILQTMVTWSRHAGIMGFSANTQTVFAPKESDEAHFSTPKGKRTRESHDRLRDIPSATVWALDVI